MKQHKKRYDVFISYRRDGGEETAKHLRDALTERGYKVFLDVESLRNGPFNEALYKVIDESKDFLLILPQNALDRCENENDWVRLEIERAHASGKNIVPIMLKGFTFPDELPESIDFIRYQNAPPSFEISFFDAFVDKLQTFMVSKRKQKWKKALLAGIAALLTAALAFGIFYFNYTYPLWTKDKNLVSDLIAYLSANMMKYDLAGVSYTKEIDRARQYVEGKTDDSEGTLKLEITESCSKIRDYKAGLYEVPDQLRDDLMKDSHFDMGDIAAYKTYLSETIDGYLDSMEYIRDFVISENNLRSETHVAYLNMLKGMAELDAEVMFYGLNETLLSVTNKSALDTLKNTILPQMSFVYAKRLDLTGDREALIGKRDAVIKQYDVMLAEYEEALQREEENVDPEYTLALYDSLIAYREERGMDASDLIERREKFKENLEKLEQGKLELVEDKKKMQQLREEAYEKFKPSEDDDMDALWGKGKRFLTLKMPEAAAECFDMFVEKCEDKYKIAGKSAKRFTEVCTALELKGGVVVGLYEEGRPHQAVEIGDVIYEADGNLIHNNTEYTAAVAEKGVHNIKLIRFNNTGYDLLDSVIDTSLGSISTYGLNDEGTG